MRQHVARRDRDEHQHNRHLHDHNRRVEIGRLLDADHQNGSDHRNRQERDDVEHCGHVLQAAGIDPVLL
jgi:hypothetical protein